jgi:acetate kinase
MADALIVLNAGSSSLKFSLYTETDRELALQLYGQIEGLMTAPRFVAQDASGAVVGEQTWSTTMLDHSGATAHLLAFLRQEVAQHEVVAIGHRVVHGGTRFERPMIVDDEVLRDLEALIPLAPLHQPHNLAPIRALAAREPALPQVACFDTSFHRTQPPLAQAFALPPEITERGVRPYGFHGLSYEYIAGRLPSLASDMRTLLASDDPRARLSVDLFCYRITRELGSLTAALGGLDALVFTGGIAEHAARIRAQVLRNAGWLGFVLDTAANDAHGPLLTQAGSRARAYAIPTDEALVIARHTRDAVAANGVA